MARGSMSTPFVARETQVAQLRAAVERAGHGDPTLVLLGADAGVGKSRLLQHVAALAEQAGATTLVTHCVDLGEIGLPYLPFADALARLVTAGGDEVARAVESRPALGRLLPADGSDTPPVVDDAASRLQLFDGMASVLAAAGRPGAPLVLVVEDLHWADSSSRDLLRFLVARLRSEHVLLVASYRADDLHRRHPLRPVLAEMARHPRVERIELAPFTPAELRAFTTALLGSPLADSTFAEVVQRSEGNAFFAEELLESGTADPALPWTLSEVLSARLEQLDPPVQQVARVAAVAGRRVSEPLLRAVLDAQGADVDLDATLREAVAHHVLVGEDGRIAFRHALLAEAVYGDLLPGEQVALHRDYLRALTAAPELGSPAQIAHHALRSHDLPTALRASRAAALDARRVLAPLEELRHLETVLRLWSAVPTAAQDLGETRTDVLLAAATAASGAGGGDRAVALAREAVEGPDAPPAREAELRTALARHLLAVDRVDDALAETAVALRVLGAGTGGPDASAAGGPAGADGTDGTGAADGTDDATVADRARPWALATYARAALNADLDEEAERTVTEAIESARRLGHADAEADALITLAVLVAQDADQAAELLADALVKAREAGDLSTELRCTFNLASNRYYAGDLRAAAATTAAGLARARESGQLWSAYGVELGLFASIVRYAQGDLTPPDREGEDGPETATAALHGAELYAAVARGDAGVIERGRALGIAARRDPMILMIAGGCTVDALVWAGRHDEAVTLAVDLIEQLERAWNDYFLGGIWLSALALGSLADQAEQLRLAGTDPGELLARGRTLRERADITAARGRPRGGRLGPEGRAWLARAHAEHARLEGTDDEVQRWAVATEAFGYGYRYEETRTRWRWAEALLRAGERGAARTQAATAYTAAVAMGAAPLAAALRDLSRRGRLDLPGVTSAGLDVLTPREDAVLSLVAAGLTNRQIGERLFISAKTVSVHISNLLGKLHASGRAEAVAVAHQRGLLGVHPSEHRDADQR